MENIIISKEFLDWYEYYNECKEKVFKFSK